MARRPAENVRSASKGSRRDHDGHQDGQKHAPKGSRELAEHAVSRGRGKPDLASAAAPSQRMLRVAEMVRHALSEVLQRGHVQDDVLDKNVITIPEVRMSPDLKLATVYIMPLGGGDSVPVIAALERHKKFIRGIIARVVNLKYAPELRFRRDETFDEAQRINRLIDGTKPAPAPAPAPDASDGDPVVS